MLRSEVEGKFPTGWADGPTDITFGSSASAVHVLALFSSESNLSECHLSSYTHVTPVVSRRKNRGLESAHVTTPGAVMGDRVMAYSLRSSHTRPVSRLLLHLSTCSPS